MSTFVDDTSLRISTVVQALCQERLISRTVQPEDTLIEVGLTSLDTVKLVLLVEDEFDLTLPLNEINPANFRSIATIASMIARLLDHV